MTKGHVKDHCAKPSWFLRKWRNRVWRCDCGKMWHTVYTYGMGMDGWWEWREIKSE